MKNREPWEVSLRPHARMVPGIPSGDVGRSALGAGGHSRRSRPPYVPFRCDRGDDSPISRGSGSDIHPAGGGRDLMKLEKGNRCGRCGLVNIAHMRENLGGGDELRVSVFGSVQSCRMMFRSELWTSRPSL
jgi:hypothetical protein